MNYSIIFYLTGNIQISVFNGYRIGNLVINTSFDVDQLYTDLIKLVKESKLITIVPPENGPPLTTINVDHIVKMDFFYN